MNNEIEVVFKSSVVTVKYNQDYNLAYVCWNEGILTMEKYKEPYLFLLDNFKSEVVGIISDIRKQSVVGPEMRTWFQKDASKRAKLLGLKYFYVVTDSNVFKQYYINTILKFMTSDGIERKIFSDYTKCELAIVDSLSKSMLLG